MNTLHTEKSGAASKHTCSLLPFDCPLCGARRLVFVLDARQKNASQLISFSDVNEETSLQCVLICPKCKKKLALCTRRSKVVPA